ncbi:MAG: type II secretion system secretin GspD [Alphaproteobacteria bacterium]
MWGRSRHNPKRPHERARRAAIAVLCLAAASCSSRDAQETAAPRPSLPEASSYAGVPGGTDGARREAGSGTSLSGTRAEAKVYPGTGVFLSSPKGGEKEPGTGEYTVNFVNADIRQVIDRILGDVLKANYVIEDEVSGNVTIQTSSPVSREDLIPILESALSARGGSLVEDGGVYRIVAAENASRAAGLPDPSALGFGIRAVPLKFVSAAEMKKILEPIAPEGAIRRVDRHRNMIMLAGTSRELSNMIETVRLFDVDWLKGMSFALLPVRSAEAEAVAQELKTVFAAEEGGPGEGMVRFVPVKRLNAVLAISPQERYVRRAAAWAERLDRFSDDSGKQLFVYDVQNRPAAELAELLQQAFSDRPARRERREEDVAPGLEPATLTREADAPEGDSAAEDAPQAPPPDSRRDRTRSVVESERLRIFADESNNSLVIIATPQDHKLAVKMIERLDVIPNQVLLEATIAEVTLEDELSYGLQWFFRSGESEFQFTEFEGVGPETPLVDSVFPGFSWLFSGSDVRVALNAISSLTDVKVISSPTLMVLDNKTATLQVGDEVPVVTQSAVSVNDPDSPIVNSVNFRDTGVILKVTPRVNESGVVLLDIEQEVSDVVQTTSSGIDSPTIRQRRIQTTVAVHNGESLALGGLIRESDGRNQSGVPLLSRVPVLGNLFKSKTDTRDRTELLVLITPRVVRNQGEARAVTEELRGRLRALKPLGERIE